MNDIPKSCSTCEHRSGLSLELSKCMASGVYCTTERKYPTVCGVGFDAWQRRLSVTERVVLWFKGRS